MGALRRSPPYYPPKNDKNKSYQEESKWSPWW